MKCIVGKSAIAEQADDFLHDESRFTLGIPRKLCFPGSIGDIRTLLLESAREGVPFTIIGGKTGITGGSVPQDGCTATCLSGMAKILGIRRLPNGDPMLLCEPGVSLETISRFCDDPGAWEYAVDGIEALKDAAWFYPPDPTEMTAHLGGTVATNASGARSFLFGPTRAHIEELSVAFASGDTATIRRGACKEVNSVFSFRTDQGARITFGKPAYLSPLIKNASGYFSGNDMDLMDLFIGSEGTLAVFTAIGIRLTRKPRFVSGLSFFPDLSNALAAAAFLRRQPGVAALEYFDASALAILEASRESMSLDLPQFPAGQGTAVYWEFVEKDSDPFENRMDEWENVFIRHGSSFENTWSGFEKADMDKLKSFRHAVPEAVNAAIARYNREYPGIRKISTDAAFPEAVFESSTVASLDLAIASKLEYAVFGHLGDFHLHFNLMPRNESEFEIAKHLYEEMMEIAIAAGGTVSAEHGIGKLKRSYLSKMFGVHAIDEMKRIKSSLDPQWLLNRGNLFEYDPAFSSPA